MLNDAVISVLSMPIIPYLPELRRVSFTAGHNTLHCTGYMSLCVFANAGPAAVSIIKPTTTNRFIRMLPPLKTQDTTIETPRVQRLDSHTPMTFGTWLMWRQRLGGPPSTATLSGRCSWH